MKVALSHDWLNGMRGGEKCLEVLCELYPASPIHTLFREPGKISGPIAEQPIRTSRLQRFPKVYSQYRNYLPFFPGAIESFNLEGYDLVISTSHCVAKGIRKPRGAKHLSYCFTPMRYAWCLFEEYFGRKNALSKAAIQIALKRLKRWDLESNDRVDRFVAISRHIQKRIKEFYGRDSDVVYPPAATDFYTPDETVRREDFFLIVSALVPYKRLDVAVQAFNRLGRRLVVIGDGPEAPRLKELAKKNVTFRGWQSDENIRDHYRRASALIFPGEEDFGIVPVEAQACGLPVIALGRGGALETVEAGKTGLFFEEPSEEALCEAVLSFEAGAFAPEDIRANSLRFGRQRFKDEMAALVRGFAGEGR
ncbi:MAG TPA: glycosyltransferase [Candidatus Eisenbacteria bacterium]|jgi:glycosyltransferase involved in cell wall biosynthesis|nr:glycosyltransferase [Candidatus Eisenbacteria bacterium]